jgi:hypothetical protein
VVFSVENQSVATFYSVGLQTKRPETIAPGLSYHLTPILNNNGL